MKTLVGVVLCLAAFAAEEAKKPVEAELSEMVQVKLENLDLKFRADLAAMNALRARMEAYQKQYKEITDEACKAAGFKDPCVVEGKVIKPQPPPPATKKPSEKK